MDKIWHLDAEEHADYGDVVEIETGSRILIWRRFVFLNRIYLYLSRGSIYSDQIWFADSD